MVRSRHPSSRRIDPGRFLPLKPVDLHVLLVLARGERHGYGVVQEIEADTDGRLRLLPGNLYAVLARMMRDGLVEESDRRPAREAGDQRRRYYAITTLGRQVLAAELARLRGIVQSAESRNIIGKPRTAP